ncbi:MAG: tocopherol cyclase family protein [Nitriliruptoraceae bacterium]
MAGLLHPERYHGRRRRPPFFEGWYFKLVDASGTSRYAVIPGIFLSEDPAEQHAFIQLLDGTTGEASYHRYPADAFRAADDRFEVELAGSRFSLAGLRLDIDDDQRRVTGDVRLGTHVPWPVRVWSPGVMGPYAYIPRMECNHGVLSFDHRVDGHLTIDGTTIDLDDGRGYLEKDWGAAFPAGYVWMQSNHFATRGTSVVASIAIVPWLRSAFPGFLVGLRHDGVLHRFATYTGARTEALRLTDDHIDWTIVDRRARLRIRAHRASAGLLLGPTRQRMESRVGETMLAEIEVRLEDRRTRTVLEGTGRHAGLEVHGDLERLLALQT